MILFERKCTVILAGALLLVASAAVAREITVGHVEIKIPEPDGYVAVTPKMEALTKYLKTLIAPPNELFVTFISEADSVVALSELVPGLTRRFTVSATQDLIEATVSRAEFAKAKTEIQAQNAKLWKEIEEAAPGAMERLSKGASERLDRDVAVSMTGIVPFPAHLETPPLLAYSMLMKYQVNGGNGEPISLTTAATMTLAHVKGKVLLLIVCAEEDGLEWSKDASKAWAESIVEANPLDLAALVEDLLPPGLSHIHWLKVGIVIVLGAMLGSVIGLGMWLKHRRIRKAGSTPHV